MTQTIIDTITNLMGTVVQEEKSDKEEKSDEDENDWDNLDI